MGSSNPTQEGGGGAQITTVLMGRAGGKKRKHHTYRLNGQGETPKTGNQNKAKDNSAAIEKGSGIQPSLQRNQVGKSSYDTMYRWPLR